MSESVFHGFELLLFKKFCSNPEIWLGLRKQIENKLSEGKLESDITACDINEVVQGTINWSSEFALKKTNYDYLVWQCSTHNQEGELDLPTVAKYDSKKLPEELWYLSVCLHRQPRRLIDLCRYDLEHNQKLSIDHLLTKYVDLYNITEFHLDSIFKFREDRTLPKELFRCHSMRILSLKYNCLEAIPPDIGRLKQLEYLALTNNRLQIHSLPYTLTFCTKLRTILLDNNQLDALPGFLLTMPSIETVHRHGNHNYFKSTFMWYHTDVDYRIIPTSGNNVRPATVPDSLQFMAAQAIIGTRTDFFNDPDVAGILKDYISSIYTLFNVCSHCNAVLRTYLKGNKVITFKNPYLGNTCVPFMHWTCSLDCAKSLEVPARQEQIKAACMLDSMYEQYIIDCQRQFGVRHQTEWFCSCLHTEESSSGGDKCVIL